MEIPLSGLWLHNEKKIWGSFSPPTRSSSCSLVKTREEENRNQLCGRCFFLFFVPRDWAVKSSAPYVLYVEVHGGLAQPLLALSQSPQFPSVTCVWVCKKKRHVWSWDSVWIDKRTRSLLSRFRWPFVQNYPSLSGSMGWSRAWDPASLLLIHCNYPV